MNKTVVLSGILAIVVFAAVVWRSTDLPDESARQVTAVDAEQAAVERTLERTHRESRTGVEALPTEAAPAEDFLSQPVLPPQAVFSEPGADADSLPEGYSLGTYRGQMLRAPRSGDAVPEPSPNPQWLDPAHGSDAILEQAVGSGREFTFAALRLLPGTDLAGLDRSLVAQGARIEGVSGEFARIRIPAERSRLESIARLPGVLGIGAVPPEIKTAEAFVQEMLSRPAGALAPVYITLMASDPAGEWRRALSGLGVVVGAYDSDLRSYTANLPAAALARVVAADFVLSVEPVPVVTANHDSAVPVMGVDGLRQYDTGMERFSGLTGSGIAVGVLDTGLNTSHMDIAHGRASICGANFVTDENWDLWLDLDGHGTHVFGTIAGAGRVNPLLAGMVPGLSHLRFGKVLSAEGFGSGDDIRRGMDYLSGPTSCSWQGATTEAAMPLIVNMSLAATSLAFSGRGVGERKLDSVVHGHSQLYVVAQSNAGVHGFSNYGTAKNSLAVGAIDDAGIIAGFSSHGPTSDGRLAPNVVGTGVRLTSARGQASRSGHVTFSGTSMASPSVAGVAALLMEARPDFRNRPALTRARLMASAIRPHAYLESRTQLPGDNTDGTGGFNNLYGLGLVSARTSLFSNSNPQGWLIGSASAKPGNDTYEYIDINVPQGAARLDIVLTWDEQPADTLTRSVLNNLDLWADEGAECAEEACGEHASRSEVDNVEWLLIEDPAPGTYRVKVVPVEVYGESSTAAVAWQILLGQPHPRLDLDVEAAPVSNALGDFLTVDVVIESSGHVASGTTIHLNCRAQDDDCGSLRDAYLPRLSRVYREDGLSRKLSDEIARYNRRNAEWAASPIPVGEVALDAPRRVQLWFLREKLPTETVLNFTATSWNAVAAGLSLALSAEGGELDKDIVAPPNDSFSASERILGTAGRTPLELALASREPGELLVEASTRTVWYVWDAPNKGLFRFRARKADSSEAAHVDFALFTGEALTELELAAQKSGREVSFNAKAGTRYRLRIASDAWAMAPLVLEWEPADVRPANDDFAYAQTIEGESSSIDSTNEGATLERSEFWGGYAATVWYEWTAPADGFVRFEVDVDELNVLAFTGAKLGELRLVEQDRWNGAIFAVQRDATYRIAVTASDADASGAPFTLSWEFRVEDFRNINNRRNDHFQDAVPIEGQEGAVHNLLLSGGSVIPFTVQPREPLATGIGTGWWYWTAPRDGRFTWRLNAPSAFQLSFLAGDDLDDLRFIAAVRGGSALVLEATANTRYWIALGRPLQEVQAGSPSETGGFTWGMTPANDDRVDAQQIRGAAGSVNASLTHATAEASEPRSTVGLESVWWQWEAPSTGWIRFWVDGHPLGAIVSIHSGRDAGARASRATGDSERSFLANGRVEVHLLARAGERYDIRLSARPGTDPERSMDLRWAASEAPAFLSYRGAVTEASLLSNPVFEGLRSPGGLAMSDDGLYLFSASASQLYALVRDTVSGAIAPVYKANSGLPNVNHTRLWWNASHDRLFAMDLCSSSYSVALPEAGSLMDHRRINVDDGYIQSCSSGLAGPVDPDGRHLYSPNRSGNNLTVHRFDSPTSLALVQVVSSHDLSRDDQTVIPNLTAPVDAVLSPDGLHLYLVDERGLFVFSRDVSSGQLAPVREILHDGAPDDPFYEMGNLTDVSFDANSTVLFVSGRQSRPRPAFDSTIAAFDISGNPSNPAHLDTLTDIYFESDQDAFRAWSHLSPRGPYTLENCNRLVPHADLAAVDVFCRNGYYVARWNSETRALEVTDFAVSETEDRFGNTVPYFGSVGQTPQSPDGAHVYSATSIASIAYGGRSDAIHIFERASAMKPVEDDEGTGGAAVGGTTTYGVDDALPGVPTSGVFAPAGTGGDFTISITDDGTTISLDESAYFELTDGTRYTCTSADGCAIVNGTVTAGTVTGRVAGAGEVDRFPTFRNAVVPGNQTYTVGTAIDTLTLNGLNCRIRMSATEQVARIEGLVHAHADVSSVTLTGRVNGEFVDLIPLNRMANGESERFVLGGTIRANADRLDCAIELEYFELRTLRRGQPIGVSWRGEFSQ